MSPRDFAPWALVTLLVWVLPSAVAAAAEAPTRPNILWITCEDMGPHLGCYGDKYSVTPHLDRLAEQSLRYTRVWSCAPVCAPARTTLISGLYPTSTGSEHMRSMTRLPAELHFYPRYLRDAGYYCTNNSKEDYNLETVGPCWHESSGKAHYKNRPADKPFFAVFNLLETHESQIRSKAPLVHDPKLVSIPPYHPDTPETRADWARYYDNITRMDAQVGKLLAELEAQGLTESTIVFFYADHGSGMPRHKRQPQNSGLLVPLLVRMPSRFAALAPPDYRAGGVSDRLVGFIDFAPTALSLAGIKQPAAWPGRAFLGKHLPPPPEFLFGFRGRMDERQDLVRSCRDDRYVYIRNYMPHLPAGQHLAYQQETPTTRVWNKLFEEGKLDPVQSAFWKPKSPEELYDLAADPHETKNLAGDPAHAAALARMRAALSEHQLRTRDVGLLPEAEIHARSAQRSPYELGHDEQAYPLADVLRVAQLAGGGDTSEAALRRLREQLSAADPAVRYWATMGFLQRGERAVGSFAADVLPLLRDASPSVRVVAAEALARFGPAADRPAAAKILVELAQCDKTHWHLPVAALNSLDRLPPELVRPHLAALKTATGIPLPKRYAEYPQRLLEHITGRAPPARP